MNVDHDVKTDEELPYVFDLFYNIKTKKQLREELENLQQKLNNLKEFVVEWGVKL